MQFDFILLACIVVLSFSIIHAIEVTSFLSRLTGVILGKKSLAYSLQNAVFMLTRFFIMALMPILGLIVDIGVNRDSYLIMVFCALLGASLLSVSVLLLRGKVIPAFEHIVNDSIKGKSLIFSLLKFPIYFFKSPNKLISIPSFDKVIKNKIFWFSGVVFCIYSVSTFIVFYFGLIFPDYRTSISQLSGIMNAFATILLTFWVEPKISLEIDKENNIEKSSEMILSLLVGRVFGVFLLSQTIIFCLWIAS